MQPARPILRLGATLCAAAAAISFAAVPADAAPRPAGDADGPALARQLTRKVTIDAINRNFIALQRFADRNGGNRAASTNGHKETAHYARWRDAVESMMQSPRTSVKFESCFPDEPRWDTASA